LHRALKQQGRGEQAEEQVEPREGVDSTRHRDRGRKPILVRAAGSDGVKRVEHDWITIREPTLERTVPNDDCTGGVARYTRAVAKGKEQAAHSR
jgi:hypothetical protein